METSGRKYKEDEKRFFLVVNHLLCYDNISKIINNKTINCLLDVFCL